MLNFSRRPRTKIAIPLTSLIDIVFLLLIYFLLTSNFISQQTIDVQLPKAEMQTLAIEQLVVITVDKQGNFYVADIMVEEWQLANQIQRALAAAIRPEVVIKADREVSYERVIVAMDIAKKNGASVLHLAIERK